MSIYGENWGLIGHEWAVDLLAGRLAVGRIGHAYLFTGARGIGKTSTARILAKCLNCVEGPTSEPCGQCDACLTIAGGDATGLGGGPFTWVDAGGGVYVVTATATISDNHLLGNTASYGGGLHRIPNCFIIFSFILLKNCI